MIDLIGPNKQLASNLPPPRRPQVRAYRFPKAVHLVLVQIWLVPVDEFVNVHLQPFLAL